MKGLPNLSTLGLLAVAMLIAGPRAGAQQYGLSVKPSSDSILISNSLTYIINVTNLGTYLNDTFVTNVLSPSAQILNATNYYNPGIGTITNNVVVLELGGFPPGQAAQMSVTVLPTVLGFITNSVTVAYPVGATGTAFTNVVVDVTSQVIHADLGVTMTGPKQFVITNDWMTYGVTVTNSGPDAAPNVILANIVPAGVIGISSPIQNSGTNAVPLGTLIRGGSTDLQFTVEPTNAGVLLFSASVSAPSVVDPNTNNNFASTNITIINYYTNQLVVFTNSPQYINFQNALTEQSITLSNASPSNVLAARIIVTGVTNRLFNGVGTNNGNPFVYYSAPLAAGQKANLLLQYYPRGYFAFTNSQLQAFAVPLPKWKPPSLSATSTNINISRIVELANGNMLIEWPSTVGKLYTVVYSDNISFSNAMIAPPSIVAPADRTQWIDYGPPTTVSAPTNSTNAARFYRVYQNP